MSDGGAELPSAEATLLEEGARSYLDTLTAIAEFNRVAQARCRQALEGMLGELNALLGISLDRHQIALVTPDLASFTGSGVGVGVRVGMPVPAGHWTKQDLIVGWSREADGSVWFGLEVVMWFDRKAFVQIMKGRFREVVVPAGYETSSYDWGVGLYQNLTDAEASQLGDHIDGLLKAWIDLWRQSGGAQALAAGSE